MSTSEAARRGNLNDMVKALAASNKYYFLDLEYAIISGSLELVDWMLNNGFKFINGDELKVAASIGNLEMVKLLQKYGFKFDCRGGEIVSAAKNGHIEMVKWLRENKCKYAQDMENYECRTGRYEVIAATNGGHTDIVEWLMDDGCDAADSVTAAEYVPAIYGCYLDS